MNRQQKIIVSITGITLVLLILVGLTYAYFLTRIQGNTNTKSISVTTANLSLVYADGNGLITGTLIEPGEVLDSKTFTVTNEGNAETEYIVVIDGVSITYATTANGHTEGESTTFESNDFVYTLTCVQKDKTSGLETGTCESVSTETSLPLVNNGLLVANKIPENKRHEYELIVTYKETNENQSNDMNKSLEAKVDIKDIRTLNPYSSGTLAYNIINNSVTKKNGTELRAVPLSKPAEETSTYGTGEYRNVKISNIYDDDSGNNLLYIADTEEDIEENWGSTTVSVTDCNTNTDIGKYLYDDYEEMSASQVTACIDGEYAVAHEIKAYDISLSTTSDDYGTSYYYRGNVEDNYVDFAGMCWRIVRIEGDGSIKLILEDQDYITNGSPCASSNGNWDIPTTTGGSTNDGNFGYTQYANGALTASNGTTTNSKPKYVMNYLNGGTNNSSSMSTAFKNFQEQTVGDNKSLKDKIRDVYNDNTLELSDYLKIDNWCMNDKGYSQSGSSGNYTYTELSASEMLDRKVSNTTFYYDSYVRLYGKTTKEPTLKCNGTIMNKFGDNTNMYVGTLTADEIVYAGGKVNTNNPEYYLINDYQKTEELWYWSLSPDIFGDNYDDAMVVYDRGSVSSVSVNGDLSFRPAVSLKSGATISGGVGTKGDAYTIN